MNQIMQDVSDEPLRMNQNFKTRDTVQGIFSN